MSTLLPNEMVEMETDVCKKNAKYKKHNSMMMMGRENGGESSSYEISQQSSSTTSSPAKTTSLSLSLSSSSSSSPTTNPIFYKPQNPDIQKNSVDFETNSSHKDFTKRAISVVNVMSSIQRPTHSHDHSKKPPDILTVLV